MPPESHTLSGVGLDGQLGEKDCRLDRLSTYRRFIRQNFVLLKASSILYLTFQFVHWPRCGERHNEYQERSPENSDCRSGC